MRQRLHKLFYNKSEVRVEIKSGNSQNLTENIYCWDSKGGGTLINLALEAYKELVKATVNSYHA